ncbi:hypothetical protein NP006_23510, partial [Salmonella enterica]|nr:hypothetical protein [Salmonella enterica]
YRVLVTCILPLTTRDLGVMRPFHAFLLYALIHRLDIDLSLHIFHAIIYSASITTSRRVHMPYAHILTTFIGSLGIVTTLGSIRPVSESDELTQKNLALAGMHFSDVGVMSWTGEDQPQADPAVDPADEDLLDLGLDDIQMPPPPAPPAPPADPTMEERVTRIEGSLLRLEGSITSFRQET